MPLGGLGDKGGPALGSTAGLKKLKDAVLGSAVSTVVVGAIPEQVTQKLV